MGKEQFIQEYPLNKELEPRRSRCPVIVLVTDFGNDSAKSQCRLKVLEECLVNNIIPPEWVAVNDVEPYNLVNAAFTILQQTATTNIREAIIIGVVDPGVGTERQPIIIRTKKEQYFVGPNNGSFSPAAKRDGIVSVWQIDESQFPNSSATFHGRDIFSPTAAKIVCGVDHNSLGWQISEQELIPFEFREGQVVQIDQKLGNLKIFGSIPENPRGITLHHSAPLEIPFVGTFADVEIGQLLAIKGSDKLLEIAINQDNAALQLGYRVGDCLHIEWHI